MVTSTDRAMDCGRALPVVKMLHGWVGMRGASREWEKSGQDWQSPQFMSWRRVTPVKRRRREEKGREERDQMEGGR